MTPRAQATASTQSGDTSREGIAMNAIFSSGFDWKSAVDAEIGGVPLWLALAGILATALGMCPHLYL
jgi:hypothetical protein